jgi:hypothetical protein
MADRCSNCGKEITGKAVQLKGVSGKKFHAQSCAKEWFKRSKAKKPETCEFC